MSIWLVGRHPIGKSSFDEPFTEEPFHPACCNWLNMLIGSCPPMFFILSIATAISQDAQLVGWRSPRFGAQCAHAGRPCAQVGRSCFGASPPRP